MTLEPAASRSKGPLIGILALQGDVREHAKALEDCGATAVPVRRAGELTAVEGLIIPGGESTTIDKLSRIFDMRGPLMERIAEGLPVYGSCAGMIMLANEIADPATDRAGNPQQTLGGLDITVRRNAFGRQVDSFETELHFQGLAPAGDPETPLHAVFIRAPWVERVGAGVQVLATVKLPHGGPNTGQSADQTARIDPEVRAVAVRSRHLLATSFHPEVTGERRIHELFIRMIRGEA
ncbi:glutamine amidotransferase subunit PdxT [Arthrobacter sp. PAMC 25486]|uniref:pyridoxal 5'-phosphate synthase glutaminase subunit PdxT n=1 Tax=Arthrobacter sp. PAMC 25486 TaxID=1494608 RepID=UPI000536207A|nr:pyridoxal 5'-phosphate synthase glutaminase subunit PdxT [Arthrobacter sp. PAMC 25486]AIY00588.1 glutamine amidotransferase subunit PdxT [Arthrobacter sp. PAMC 25486]